MKDGRIIEGAIPSLDDQVAVAKQRTQTLPAQFRSLKPVKENPVVISDFLRALQRDTLEKISNR